MDMRRLVGQNFARLRRLKGLTQEDMQARSTFSQQYISGLENGERNPMVETLYELAVALDVHFLELLREPSSENDSATPLGFLNERKTAARIALCS